MLKKIFFVILLFSFCLSLYAEMGTVVLINRRNYWFHYCLDPQGLQEDADNAIEYLNSDKLQIMLMPGLT